MIYSYDFLSYNQNSFKNLFIMTFHETGESIEKGESIENEIKYDYMDKYVTIFCIPICLYPASLAILTLISLLLPHIETSQDTLLSVLIPFHFFISMALFYGVTHKIEFKQTNQECCVGIISGFIW